MFREGMGKHLVVKALPVRDENLFTWVTSDTHFFHVNIVEYGGRPDNHNTLMRDNWERKVKPDGRLLHLGDLAFGAKERLLDLKDLPGQKTLLLGNHDRRGPRTYHDLGYRVLKRGFSVKWEGWLVHFVHNPDDAPVLYPKQFVVHGHIHEKNIPDPRFVNLSVEQTEYSPVWLPDTLNKQIEKLEGI